MATGHPQLVPLYKQARALARVNNEQAPVYLFTDDDVPLFDTLHVARAQIKGLVPMRPDAPPIVFGWCSLGPPITVVKGYAITAELWAQRDRLPYIGYDVDTECYNIVLTAIPRMPRPHVALRGNEEGGDDNILSMFPPKQQQQQQTKAVKRPCCVRYDTWKAPWVSRERIVDWLASDGGPPVSAEAAAHYAEAALFMLEQRALLVQGLVDPELAIDRMRHGVKHFFPALAQNRLGGAASYVMSVLVPAMTHPLINAPVGKKPDGGERLGLYDALHGRGSQGMTMALAWLASEDTFVRYMLSDPIEGVAPCAQCTERLLEALRVALAENAPHAPWIRALKLADEHGQAIPLGVAVPAPEGVPHDAPWYRVPRTLAYRLPAEAENLREDPESGEWIASRSTFLYEVVPLLVEKLCVDVLWTFFDFDMRPVDEVPESLLHVINVASSKMGETRAILEGTLGRLGHEAVRSMPEWRKKIETTDMVQNAENHPLAAPPLPADDTGGQMNESLRQWYKAVRDKHRGVAARIPDIEDLLTRDLMPPCMKAAVTSSRAEGTLHNYMARFIASGWITDLGYDGADAVKLLGISDNKVANEIAAHVRNVQKKQTSVRDGQCASWSCSGNMGQNGYATDCTVRRRVAEASATSGKLQDKSAIVKVRWACTETLPNYAEGTWPLHAIVHPLDYVVLRLENE